MTIMLNAAQHLGCEWMTFKQKTNEYMSNFVLCNVRIEAAIVELFGAAFAPTLLRYQL